MGFKMHLRNNIVLALLTSALYGQSLGFWPFSAFAESYHSSYEEPGVNKVAIIGAGAAGASTAYHLQKFAALSGIPVEITVFERSSYVGGRSTTVNAYDDPQQPVELGGSIFVDVNYILKNATKLLGLHARDSETDDKEILGIWNGKSFVYTQKGNGWWDLAKILWKYGYAPIRTRNLMKKTVGKFLQLYTPPFFPFRSLSDRAFDLGLTEVTSVTGEQFLAANSIGPPFSTDIIQASTRVNYGQNIGQIHGLETMVCMAIEGAMSIEGGNWQIFDGMLKLSNATVHLNTTISSIKKTNGKYVVTGSSKHPELGAIASDKVEQTFDTVVLASPLQFSDISIEKEMLKRVPDEIPYVQLHVTLFTSTHKLNPAFFGLAPNAEVPSTVLTTLPPDTETPADPTEGVGPAGFFSISTLRVLVNPKTLEKEYLYKIFSPKKIKPVFLSGLLGFPITRNFDLALMTQEGGHPISWYYPKVWHSYPYEHPRVTFEDPELARGFYYTSGIESFISTMETSALMGMNVAQLIVDDFQEREAELKTGVEEVVQVVLEEEVVAEL